MQHYQNDSNPGRKKKRTAILGNSMDIERDRDSARASSSRRAGVRQTCSSPANGDNSLPGIEGSQSSGVRPCQINCGQLGTIGFGVSKIDTRFSRLENRVDRLKLTALKVRRLEVYIELLSQQTHPRRFGHRQ